MFLYCFGHICELNKTQKLKKFANAQIVMVYLASNQGRLIS